jgi:hypothetical protein
LDSIIGRARIILASVKKAENLPLLAVKGWIEDDTTALSNAIDALAKTMTNQEGVKPAGPGTTGELTRLANDFYDRVLAIQNAANLEWKESDPANVTIRGKFRLDTFPPDTSSAEKKPGTPAASANPTATPQ